MALESGGTGYRKIRLLATQSAPEWGVGWIMKKR